MKRILYLGTIPRLPDDQGFLLEMYDGKAFSRDAIAAFPDLGDELESDACSIDL
jgi:hypothetical protein